MENFIIVLDYWLWLVGGGFVGVVVGYAILLLGYVFSEDFNLVTGLTMILGSPLILCGSIAMEIGVVAGITRLLMFVAGY